VMLLWLKNCQRRGDTQEAGHVACVLGDRALNDGDAAGAREWFERARAFDERNEVATRRLLHLATNSADNPGGAVSEWIRPESAPPGSAAADLDLDSGADASAPSDDGDGADASARYAAAEAPSGIEARTGTPAADTLGIERDGDLEEAADAAENAGASPSEPPAPETPVEDAPAGEPVAPGASGGRGRFAVNMESEGQTAPNLADLVAEFQRGVEKHLASDPQVLYDFGVSYREMGLLDEAIEAFRGAARSPQHTLSASEMLVRCLIDQGKADEAVQELRETLRQPRLDTAGALRLRYDLGIALEATGRRDEALQVFQQLEAEQPSLWDVAQRAAMLRKSLGPS